MGWKFCPCACTGGGYASADQSIGAPRVRTETRREQERQQHATIEDCTTRRDEAAKKNPPTDRGSRRRAEDKIARGSGGAPTASHFGRECDVEHREVGFGVFAIDDIHHFLHDVGVCSRHVVVFVEIVGQVVESALAALDYQFPTPMRDTRAYRFRGIPSRGHRGAVVPRRCL